MEKSVSKFSLPYRYSTASNMFLLVISEKILWVICGLGILQGILLAALLYFHKKSDKSVNRFLALFIFFFSVTMTMPFIINAVAWQNSSAA